MLSHGNESTASGGPPTRAAAQLRPGDAGTTARENSVVAGAGLTELVGRGDELWRLEGALASIAAGHGTTMLLGGEAGIGKSRLVDELRARASRRGFIVAIGRGTPVEGLDLPYGHVVPMLRDLEHQLDPGVASEVLGSAFDALGLPMASGHVEEARRPLAGPMARTWLFEKVFRALAGVAERAPTLLVFEDVHWADPGTIGLIDFLTRNLESSSLGLALTYRDDERGDCDVLDTVLAELARLRHVQAITLTGLRGDDLAALVTGLLGRAPGRDLLLALEARSGGNPFFVQELVTSGDPSQWSPTLRAAVAGRLLGMSPEAKNVLNVASALAVVLDDDLLRELSHLGDDQAFESAVRECLDRGLLVRIGTSGSEYAFRHELVREAVYHSLLPGSRRRIHRVVAEAIQARASQTGTSGYSEAELAGHWWAAGEWREALRASIVAADAAFGVFAFEEACTHLEHALACVANLPDGHEIGIDRPTLLERAADAAYLAGGGEHSIELARAVVDALDPVAEPLRAALAYVRVARNQWALADPTATLDALAAAEALTPKEPPTRELARTLAERGRCFMLTARYRDGERVCRQALAAARAVGARSEESHVLASLGVCIGSLGQRDEAIVMLREALDIAEEIRSPEDMSRGFSNLSSMLFTAGRLEEVAELAAKSTSPGEDIAGVRLQSAALNGADAMVELGRWEEAEATIAKVGKLMGNCGNHPALVRASLAIRRGDFDLAHAELDRLLEVTEKLDDVQFRGAGLLLAAELAVIEGKPLEAYDLSEQALSTAAGTDDAEYLPQMCAVGACALADALDEARRVRRRHDPVKLQLLADELAVRMEELDARAAAGRVSLAPRAVAFGAQCRAEVTRLHAPDPDAWSKAADHWKALRQPYQRAYCEWREAEALLANRARRAKVAELLHSAWETCSALGAAPLLARVEDLAKRARVTLGTETEAARRAADVAANLGITAREVEVLGCLAAARSDAQIAEALFISKKTASVHVSNLLRKLDVGSRYEAGEVGRQAGLPPA